MSISNAQYESIAHKYDLTRMSNRRLQNDRTQEVYDQVDGYRELDESMISVSMDLGKKKIAGDSEAASELHKFLSDIRDMKKNLLVAAGFPEDYLDPIYECSDCKDTGYIGDSKCHCFRKQEIELLYDQSNIRDFLKDNNFSHLSRDFYKDDDLGRFTKAENICREAVASFADKPANLMLYGTVGTGKSFLSGCVAQELIQKGYSVIYYSSVSLFDSIAKETFSKKNQDELYNYSDYIYNCDALIIDDLGTEFTNSFVSSQLFSLINERALRKKSTIISTNLSLEEIRDRYSDRVFSRIISGFTVLKLTGPDIRTIKKQLSIGK